jgi:hypothetical protein
MVAGEHEGATRAGQQERRTRALQGLQSKVDDEYPNPQQSPRIPPVAARILPYLRGRSSSFDGATLGALGRHDRRRVDDAASDSLTDNAAAAEETPVQERVTVREVVREVPAPEPQMREQTHVKRDAAIGTAFGRSRRTTTA